jgi:hypothetical protein
MPTEFRMTNERTTTYVYNIVAIRCISPQTFARETELRNTMHKGARGSIVSVENDRD